MSVQETMITISHSEHVERIPSKIVPTINPPHKKRGGLWHVETDLSCIVGAMSRWLRKRPACVIKSGHHALKYLAGTVNYAIKYDRCNGQEWDLEEGCYTPASMHQADVFVDSSFSLNQEPFRSVTILSHGGAPISWTSGRQPFIASSTADRSWDHRLRRRSTTGRELRSSYFKSLDYKKSPAKTGDLLVNAKLIFKLVKS